MNSALGIFLPAVLVLIANVFSKEYTSERYKIITNIFYFISSFFGVIWLVLIISDFFILNFWKQLFWIDKLISISFEIFILCLVNGLSRDYEMTLKPKAAWLEEKLVKIYLHMTR